jgi:hypothetical protein
MEVCSLFRILGEDGSQAQAECGHESGLDDQVDCDAERHNRSALIHAIGL